MKANVYVNVLCLFGNDFRWKLVSFFFQKVLKPVSRTQLFAFKCNPHDSIYTSIFLFVGKVGCQQTEHQF